VLRLFENRRGPNERELTQPLRTKFGVSDAITVIAGIPARHDPRIPQKAPLRTCRLNRTGIGDLGRHAGRQLNAQRPDRSPGYRHRLLQQQKSRARPSLRGHDEAALLKYCEVDTRVVDYLSQPFRFEFVMDGKKRIYVADCARLLDDGTVEVIEAKGDRNNLGDADYVQKLDRVRELCLELGWRFKIVTRRRLFEPAAIHANVEFVQSTSARGR
jgi:hypothetical protein